MKNMGIQIIRSKLGFRNQVIIRNEQEYLFPRSIQTLQTTSQVNPECFALIQDQPLISQTGIAEFRASSAVSMNQLFNGQGDFFSLHKKVFVEGLKGMDARKVLSHLYNVNEAQNGRGVLYDANGNLIEGNRLEEYANRLNNECWAYVNGHFQLSENKEQEGFRGLDLLTIVNYHKGKPIFTKTPLEPCLEFDCLADITPESLNSQGFPTKRAPTKKYEAGKTAYFWYPRNGAVTRLVSYSNMTGFYCIKYPSKNYDLLGILASIEEKEIEK